MTTFDTTANQHTIAGPISRHVNYLTSNEINNYKTYPVTSTYSMFCRENLIPTLILVNESVYVDNDNFKESLIYPFQSL